MTALTINAHKIGNALRTGRRKISLFIDDAARMLGISREELNLLENGVVEIPEHMLVSLFATGLMMIHARSVIKDYHHRMRQWRYMQKYVMDIRQKLDDITATPMPE